MPATWHPVELEFADVSMPDESDAAEAPTVTFSHPSGERVTVPTFPTGEGAYAVRFAPPLPGGWTYEVVAPAVGLEETGSIVVEDGPGEHALHRHGYLTAGERCLRHADGTPFFWLADTAWAAGTRATIEEWERYLEYRADQGFSAVQVNALRQHDGSRPHDRLPFGDDWDLSRPDPAYFDHLDRLVAMAHDRGMVPALVALWFDYVPDANVEWGLEDDRRHPHSPEAARRLGRYLGARYGAYGAVWLVSGDSYFEEAFLPTYRAAGEALGAACQYPVRTAHQPGGQSTPAIVNDEPWLDFHMYQSGHTTDLTRPARQARECRLLHPARPVLNGEPCYADMGAHEPDRRFTREEVRAAGWLSVLGGANAGVTYGALGVWPWHRDGDEFEAAGRWGEPKPWAEAMELPSADDYGRLRELLAPFALESLSPRPDMLADDEAAAAVLPGAVLCYLVAGREITLREVPSLATATWVDPATGDRVAAEHERDGRDLTVAPPSFDGDALFVGTRI